MIVLPSELLIKQPPVDFPFEHILAMSQQAFFGELLHADLSLIDRRGNSRHLFAEFRIVQDIDDLCFGLQLLEQACRGGSELIVADLIAQPVLDLIHLGTRHV